MYPIHRPASLVHRLFEPLVSGLMGSSVECRLLRAVASNDAGLVRRMVKSTGFDLNAPLATHKSEASTDFRVQKKFFLMHEAAQRASFEMVQLLLELGAFAQVKTAWHISPMHLAAYAKRAHVVALLAEHGGDVNDPFPCLSTFWEEDPYMPTTPQILEAMGVPAYTGSEHRQYIAFRDGAALQARTPPTAMGTPRARL